MKQARPDPMLMPWTRVQLEHSDLNCIKNGSLLEGHPGP